MKIVQTLLDRVNIFSSTINEDLLSIGYNEYKVNISNLNCSGMIFPGIPFIESVWKNDKIDFELTFRNYENYFTEIEILDSNTKKILSINAFKTQIKIDDLEIYLMTENDIEKKYKAYIFRTVDLIKVSDIWNVLMGLKWIDVPFDWQGQK